MGVEGLFPTEGRGGRGLFRPSLCGKCKRRPSPFLLLLLFLRSTEGRDKSDKSIKGSPKGGTKERGRDSSSFSFLRVTVCVKEAIIFQNYYTSPFPPRLGSPGTRWQQTLSTPPPPPRTSPAAKWREWDWSRRPTTEDGRANGLHKEDNEEWTLN